VSLNNLINNKTYLYTIVISSPQYICARRFSLSAD